MAKNTQFETRVAFHSGHIIVPASTSEGFKVMQRICTEVSNNPIQDRINDWERQRLERAQISGAALCCNFIILPQESSAEVCNVCGKLFDLVWTFSSKSEGYKQLTFGI